MRGDVEEIRPKRDDESLVDYYCSESDNSDAAQSTKDNHRSAWECYKSWIKRNKIEIGEVREDHVKQFKKYLVKEYNEGTPETYFSQVSDIIGFLAETEEATHNPFNEVKKPVNEGETSKIGVEKDQLRKALLDAKKNNIEVFVYLMIALKTGLRSSEIVNLDLRDLHLDHPISKAMPDPRTEIYNYPDALYVDSSITEGETHNGEKRSDSNKKNSHREVPIDEELKSVLVWWIAMLQPSDSPADPLLRRVTGCFGRRYNAETMSEKVTDWTRRNDLNSADMKHFGVDSHWCRHWFSTTLRVKIDSHEVTLGSAKEYVQGLRGDSDKSIIETYTHEWDEIKDEDNKEYREVYEDNIPRLLADIDKEDD